MMYGPPKGADWSRMYSAGYRSGARLVLYPAGLDDADRRAVKDMGDPYIASLGLGAYLQGMRDGRVSSPPRIALAEED